jgi:Mg-chelatase subunit ChlI
MKNSSSKVFTLSPKTADAIASTYATWDEAKRKSNHDQKLFVIEIAKAYQSWDGSKEAFNEEIAKLLNVAKSLSTRRKARRSFGPGLNGS